MIKFPNKMVYVLAGIVAGAVITTVTTTSAAQIVRQQAQGSSETISSNASSEVSSEASEILSNAEPSSKVSSEEESTPASKPAESKTPIESATDAGVSKIQEATDAGVSQIHDETQKAVQEVQKAVSEVTSSESGPKITYDRNRITGEKEYHNKIRNWDVDFIGSLQEINESDKCLEIHYGGTYPGNMEDWTFLSGEGFSVKNAAGTEIATQPNGFCSFKVPYNDLSDVSELYFTYQDQSIKITVTE